MPTKRSFRKVKKLPVTGALAKQQANRPKKPLLKTYGLTEEKYEDAQEEARRLASREWYEIPTSLCLRFEAPWLVPLLAVFIVFGKVYSLSSPERWDPDGRLLAVFGLLLWIAVAAILVYGSRAARKRMQENLRQSPLFKRIERYEQAMEQYCKAEHSYQHTLEEHWISLRDVALERELADLYQKLGYEVQVTKATGDRGIDLIIKQNGSTTIVQCKGLAKPVGVGAVRDLYGALMDSGAERAILACPAGFTQGVLAFAEDKPIDLVSASELVDMAERAQAQK